MSVLEHHANTASSGRFSGVYFALAKIAKTMLYQVQLGRMIQVLSQFSDETLAEMGITRSDIPKYAAQLVNRD